METLREVLALDFLLRNSIYTGVLIGLACPLIGVYLVTRRLVFMGVALPQVSSCGIAFAFAFHTWGWIPHVEGHDSESLLAFGGSTLLTLAAIFVLSALERRRRGSVEGRVGVAYALAGAWSILLLVKNPYGEHGLLDRLKGEIIAVTNLDLVLSAGCLAAAGFALWLFRKEFLLVSFDRETAQVLGKNVMFWDLFLFVLIGLVISVAVLSVGPLVTFGFLLFPPLIAYPLSTNMRQLAWIAALIGGISSFAGFCVAYHWDLPVGPTDVALLGVLYGLAWLTKPLAKVWKGRSASAP